MWQADQVATFMDDCLVELVLRPAANVVPLFLVVRAAVVGEMTPGECGSAQALPAYVALSVCQVGRDVQIDTDRAVPFGECLIEQIFSLDGLGLLGYTAVLNRDFPLIMSNLFVFTIIGLFCRLLTDICYVIVDPRISFDENKS